MSDDSTKSLGAAPFGAHQAGAANLDELLDRYEELCAEGAAPRPDELCAACPELLPELREAIAKLETVERLLRADRPVNGTGRTEVRLPQPAGRFRPLRFHAAGGLGAVFVAVDEELGREVALKHIRSPQSADRDSRERFVIEARVTGRLEHPGIVPVYGLGHDEEGRPYYAMRFIRGETLAEAIAHFHRADVPGRDPGERSLELQKLLRTFLAVCQTVAYAHSRGIVHRDLKPANIMLGGYGETLVVDWGLAKVMAPTALEGSADSAFAAGVGVDPLVDVAGLERTWGIKGSPAYMSPEQAAGDVAAVSPASDIYCLGATLYALLTGEAPFQGRSAWEVAELVRAGTFIPPRGRKQQAPPALEAICLRAMRLQPEQRYASATALAADVEHWLADEPVTAWREPPSVRARRWLRRHKAVFAATAGSVVVALISFVIATLVLHDKNVALGKSRDAETRAKNEAIEQENLAHRQFLRAERNLGRARQAVETYLTTAAENPELVNRGLFELRKTLLATAAPFLEDWSREEGATAEEELERGRATFRLSTLRRDLGETDAALADCERALGMIEALGPLDAAPPERRHLLGQAHTSRGVLLQDKLRRDQALKALDKAIELLQPLSEAAGDPSAYRLDLAKAHANRAMMLHLLNRDTDALPAFEESRRLQEDLAQRNPGIPKYQEALAANDNNRGLVLSAMNRFADARVANAAAIRAREGLVKDFPTVQAYVVTLAGSYVNQADLLRDHVEVKDSLDLYAKAIERLERIIAQEPRHATARRFLGLAYWGRAKARAQLLQYTPGLADCERAIALADDLRDRIALGFLRAALEAEVSAKEPAKK